MDEINLDVDPGFGPRVMDMPRLARALRLLSIAVAMLGVLTACDFPASDGADAAPVPTAQPTVVATATPARPVAPALETATPVATAAAVETRAERPGLRTPTASRTAAPSSSPKPTPAETATPSPSPTPTQAVTAVPSPLTDTHGFRAAGTDAGDVSRGVAGESCRRRSGGSFPSFRGLRRSRCT